MMALDTTPIVDVAVSVRKRHQQQGEIMILLPALYWNQQSCFSAGNTHISCKHMSYEMRPFIANAFAYTCCANWIAWSVKGVYCMTELFWKQLLNEVRVKIILISSSRWWRFLTATSAIGPSLVIFPLLGLVSHTIIVEKGRRRKIFNTFQHLCFFVLFFTLNSYFAILKIWYCFQLE